MTILGRRSVLLGAIATAVAVGTSRADGPDAFRARVAPILDRFCVDCHSKDDPEAGVVLDRRDDRASAIKDGATWLRVRDAVEGRSMPPDDAPQPTAADRATIVGWIEDDLLADRPGDPVPPARHATRRLNRREYNRTIRDLIGLDLRLADAFPPDEIGFGYDNVGSALNVSPVHVEGYLDAAEAAMDRAIVVPDAEGFPPIELIGLKTYPLPADVPVEFDHALKPGRYRVEFSLVRAGIAESVPPPRLVVGLGVDRRTVVGVRVQDETVVYRYWLAVAPGDTKAYVALAPGQADGPNTAKAATAGANVSGDQRYGGERGLHVDSMVVRGPVVDAPSKLPASHWSILGDPPGPGDPARIEHGKRAIARFAARAFRRPVPPDELAPIVATFRLALDRGESHERCVQLALTAVLASPRFLFLVEPDAGGADPFATASRLSYFLWGSMPDDELLAEARAGTLGANLRRQAVRMLDDPRSSALVEDFAGQWLGLGRLGGSAPDKDMFPGFSEPLRAAMRRETELYFAAILRDDRSLLELIDSDYTFLNGPLARHYGIAGVDGDDFRRVTLADRRRGGVLTQASILTLTSNPNRTSPVKRGQWIMQQILGTPPPPPPPDVPKLDEGREAADLGSLRDRLEAHRADPRCASCHRQMDPLGFALENYDAVGRWRSRDGQFPIDPSGELGGGRAFADAPALKRLLAADESRAIARTFIKNMLTYALGRGLVADDHRSVESIRRGVAADGFRARGVVLGIVESRAFGGTSR